MKDQREKEKLEEKRLGEEREEIERKARYDVGYENNIIQIDDDGFSSEELSNHSGKTSSVSDSES